MEEVFDILLGRLDDGTGEVPSEIVILEEERTGRPWAYRNPVTGTPKYLSLSCLAAPRTHAASSRFNAVVASRVTDFRPRHDLAPSFRLALSR